MALSSTLYAAISGLSALGTGMQTISNNIANVSTVGFKAGRTNYEDLISQNYFSGGKVNQSGTGVKVSSIQSMFTQGSFMTSSQDTDMAIAGEGFFNVRNPVTNAIMYTRAGNFTLTKDGEMEDPSGNILQGWAMSIPKPGEDAIRIGAPTDVKIIVMNAPPMATTRMKIVTNLNAADKPSYLYDKTQFAFDYADALASPIAESAKTHALYTTWNVPASEKGHNSKYPVTDKVTLNPSVPFSKIKPSENSPDYNALFIDSFNAQYGVNIKYNSKAGPADNDHPKNVVANLFKVYPTSSDPKDNLFDIDERANGQMTQGEYDSMVTVTDSKMVALAASNGSNAYSAIYKEKFDAEESAVKAQLQQWQLEGHGFAQSWDGSKTSPQSPIDTDNYSYAEPMVIFDSLGNERKLMTYYQKNPHMDNVWDYIITCDPTEDARKDKDLSTLFDNPASFSGLIQKGKITFTSDTDGSGHAGVIKDIESQNLDLENSRMAYVDEPRTTSATAILANATIGGYYTGSPTLNPVTGVYDSSPREYDIRYGSQDTAAQWQIDFNEWYPANMRDPEDPKASESEFENMTGRDKLPYWDEKGNKITSRWMENVPHQPPTPGFTVTDKTNGTTEFIPILDDQHTGPYLFGSGLSITFDSDRVPLKFGVPGGDNMKLSVKSEQIAWTNNIPNEQGYYDFDVSFLQSASMATHPPYPDMPTISQTVTMDMGAKYNGSNPKWILDEQSTTQYADDSSNIFSAQDGFPPGNLQRVSIGEDGVVTGIYSNGRHQELYTIGLTRFLNPWGLSKEGDNLYSDTRYSGSGALNPPGHGGTGTVLSNFLEQSNVDLAAEIVTMITTQRGFQSNSKVVTTVDTMLNEVINMKR